MSPSPMDSQPPDLLVQITLFETEKGGRQSPILPPHFTCPLMVNEELFTCRLYFEAAIHPGQTFTPKMRLLLAEVQNELRPGATFALWDGRPIASGMVLQID